MAPTRKRAADDLLAKQAGLTPEHLRPSHELIYESMLRGGGEPFGAPLGAGMSTLTQKVVAYFKQKGHFLFETFEKLPAVRTLNKFTRQGASPFRGEIRRRDRN